VTPIATAEELDRALAGVLGTFRRVTPLNIAALAARTADALGFHSCPRPARPLLHQVGVLVDRSSPPLQGLAAWSRRDGRYVIRIAGALPADRVSLVLWHEFFEILAAHPAFPSRLHDGLLEALAGSFAVHMLLPAPEVRRQCRRLGHPETDRTGTLASWFGVPFPVMLARLRRLGLGPRRCTGLSRPVRIETCAGLQTVGDVMRSLARNVAAGFVDPCDCCGEARDGREKVEKNMP